MEVDNEGPVAEITLERYRLRELPANEMASLEHRIQNDDELRRRVDALALSDEQLRTSELLERVAAGVRHRLKAERAGAEHRVRTPVARWAIPSAVVATALVALSWTIFVPAGGDDRIKGLDSSLTLFRQVAAGSETLADGAVAREGDIIRVGYRAAGQPYGIILSIDGRRHVTMHLPTSGDRAVALGREPTVLLDHAYELDDAPRWERFYFITGEEPFPIAPILSSAERAIATAGDGVPVLALAAGLRQSVVSLQKESTP